MDYKLGTATKSSREFSGFIPDGQPAVRTLGIASLEGALDFYDFIMFPFFATAIGTLFFSAGLADWIRQLQERLSWSIVASQPFSISRDFIPGSSSRACVFNTLAWSTQCTPGGVEIFTGVRNGPKEDSR